MKSRFILILNFFLLPLILIVLSVSIKRWLQKEDKEQPEEVYQPITPRLMHGVDTIRAADSLYVISFAIKKVIPDTIDNESQDKYENDDYE